MITERGLDVDLEVDGGIGPATVAGAVAAPGPTCWWPAPRCSATPTASSHAVTDLRAAGRGGPLGLVTGSGRSDDTPPSWPRAWTWRHHGAVPSPRWPSRTPSPAGGPRCAGPGLVALVLVATAAIVLTATTHHPVEPGLLPAHRRRRDLRRAGHRRRQEIRAAVARFDQAEPWRPSTSRRRPGCSSPTPTGSRRPHPRHRPGGSEAETRAARPTPCVASRTAPGDVVGGAGRAVRTRLRPRHLPLRPRADHRHHRLTGPVMSRPGTPPGGLEDLVAPGAHVVDDAVLLGLPAVNQRSRSESASICSTGWPVCSAIFSAMRRLV